MDQHVGIGHDEALGPANADERAGRRHKAVAHGVHRHREVLDAVDGAEGAVDVAAVGRDVQPDRRRRHLVNGRDHDQLVGHGPQLLVQGEDRVVAHVIVEEHAAVARVHRGAAAAHEQRKGNGRAAALLLVVVVKGRRRLPNRPLALLRAPRYARVHCSRVCECVSVLAV